MDSKSTSIKVLDLPFVEGADDTLTANIRGGGQTTGEIGACGVVAGLGLLAGPFTSLAAGTACLMLANED